MYLLKKMMSGGGAGPARKKATGLIVTLVLLFNLLIPITPAGAGFNEWSSGGPAGVAISAVAVSLDFDNDDTIFAGGNGDGVFRSVNGGATWVAVNNNLTNMNVLALAISPNFATDQTIFAGTDGGGVFKSTNAGASWADSNDDPPLADNEQILSMAISPNFANDNTVFAGSRGDDVFKSVDGGATWTAAVGVGGDVNALVVSPDFAVDNTIYAGIRGGDNVIKSVDGGDNWVAASTGITGSRILSLAVTGSGAAQTLFAGDERDGLFMSVDSGDNWVAVDAGLPPDNGDLVSVRALAFSPNFASDGRVFLGADTAGVLTSADGGDNWSPMNDGLTDLDVASLAIAPSFNNDGTVIAGTGDGVFVNMLDTVPPVGAVVINGGAANTNNRLVTLNLTATDPGGSGVTDMRVAQSLVELATTPFKPFATTDTLMLAGADGDREVIAQFRDAAGNVSDPASDTILLDTTGPTGSVLINAGATHTDRDTVTLNFAATDALTGVPEMRFAQSQTALAAMPFQPFSTGDTFKFSGSQGMKGVFVQFRDGAGNESAVFSDTINMRRATTLRFFAKPRTTGPGQQVRLSGRLRDRNGVAVTGVKIKIRHNGRVVAQTRTGNDGRYTLNIRPRQTRALRATFDGGNIYTQSKSRLLKVNVRN
jgi:hypothetical protein